MIKAFDVEIPRGTWEKGSAEKDIREFLASGALTAEIDLEGTNHKTVEARYRQAAFRGNYQKDVTIRVRDRRLFLLRKVDKEC